MTIVLGYDGSGCARCALRAALELCWRLDDRLVIAYAYEPPARMVGEEFAEHRRAARATAPPIAPPPP